MSDKEHSTEFSNGVHLGVGALSEALNDPLSAIQIYLEVALGQDPTNPLLKRAAEASLRASFILTSASQAASEGTITIKKDPNAEHLPYLNIPLANSLPILETKTPRIFNQKAS